MEGVSGNREWCEERRKWQCTYKNASRWGVKNGATKGERDSIGQSDNATIQLKTGYAPLVDEGGLSRAEARAQ